MEIEEKKLGRVFGIKFSQGENFLAGLSEFAREREIKEASLFVFGAMNEGRMITGFRSAEGYDVSRRSLGSKREFVAYGTLTWPEEKPLAIEDPEPWDGPQPYAHLHMTVGPPVGEEQSEVLAGHLSKAIALAIFVDVYELL
ncbi:MAG: DUF296 domain-containing protein [bacterium]